MTARPIDKLESQLQALIEGAFARLFGRTVRARDLAILLRRTMEDSAVQGRVPDSYQISLNPDTLKPFVGQYPDLPARFAALIVEFSGQSGYQLRGRPQVELLADSQLAGHEIFITASHSLEAESQTTAMQPATVVPPSPPHRPMLHIVKETKAVPLTQSLINIGRESNNDIVIRDARVSRHHLQLRKRFGAYTLFDVNSRGGTLVNDTAVREHRLQDGDVIHIGHTRLVYTDKTAHRPDDITQTLDSV